MENESFWELQRFLSAEFSKYALSHPEMDEQIPDGAQVVFNLKDNSEFNEWAVRIARSQQDKNQPVVIVKIKEISSVPVSRLIHPELKFASSI